MNTSLIVFDFSLGLEQTSQSLGLGKTAKALVLSWSWPNFRSLGLELWGLGFGFGLEAWSLDLEPYCLDYISEKHTNFS